MSAIDPVPAGQECGGYVPKPGDQVHVTLAMVVDGAGQYRVFSEHGSLIHLVSPADRHVVRVERALPVAEGALVLARLDCQGVCLLELVNTAAPFSDEPSLAWLIKNTDHRVGPYLIEPGWVQIDPETLLPMEATR